MFNRQEEITVNSEELKIGDRIKHLGTITGISRGVEPVANENTIFIQTSQGAVREIQDGTPITIIKAQQPGEWLSDLLIKQGYLTQDKYVALWVETEFSKPGYEHHQSGKLKETLSSLLDQKDRGDLRVVITFEKANDYHKFSLGRETESPDARYQECVIKLHTKSGAIKIDSVSVRNNTRYVRGEENKINVVDNKLPEATVFEKRKKQRIKL